jgi:D-alanyl-D-alanine carboxypeptidase
MRYHAALPRNTIRQPCSELSHAPAVLNAVIFCLALVTLGAPTTRAQDIVPAPPQLGAAAYLLVDATTGAVLVEHNADEQLPPASLTKLMTAYVLATEIGPVA